MVVVVGDFVDISFETLVMVTTTIAIAIATAIQWTIL